METFMTTPAVPIHIYAPYVATLPDGEQVLVQLFIDPNTNEIEDVHVAFREHPFDSWSPPYRTKKG
jgi:hypothetical protein